MSSVDPDIVLARLISRRKINATHHSSDDHSFITCEWLVRASHATQNPSPDPVLTTVVETRERACTIVPYARALNYP